MLPFIELSTNHMVALIQLFKYFVYKKLRKVREINMQPECSLYCHCRCGRRRRREGIRNDSRDSMQANEHVVLIDTKELRTLERPLWNIMYEDLI